MTPEQRSRLMSKIQGKDTAPELRVRKIFFDKGYRYRIHVADLPGTPDLVFPARKLAVFIHGCFWHQHRRCCQQRKSAGFVKRPPAAVVFIAPRVPAAVTNMISAYEPTAAASLITAS